MNALDKIRIASNSVTKHSDFLLVGIVVAVLVLMIIPLPTFMVDLLISFNLAMSFVILMMTMYAPSVLGFSSFPTLLLFTTLFRVGLNISTTRLILLQADAGEIIYTFGEFAVGGNFIVGSVVFIIIAIVQFLVIAKGAERVSEVGARFSLDAMPGKQMSIDADLRSGSIDSDEAQLRRKNVSLESQMYGAMDGAMKFVKGDAIAGLLIAEVNIVAGSIIGTSQNNLELGEALQLYGILTIGDGLVSQIPSLLIAMSAGILVTRSGESDNVGAQIGEQVFSQPRALLIAGALVFLFGLVPGFPKPQLFTLALVLCAIGYSLKYMKTRQMNNTDPKKEIENTLKPTVKSQGPKRRNANGEEFSPIVPIILDLSTALYTKDLDYTVLNDELASLRSALYFDLGVPFPGIILRENPFLKKGEYVINLNEIPVSRGELEIGYLLVRDDPDNIRMLGLDVKEGLPFMPKEKAWWTKAENKSKLDTLKIRYLTCEKVISFNLSTLLARNASEFLGLQETKFLLDKMETLAPDLVHEATRLLPMQKLSDLFKRLVQEQISIRDLRSILEAIINWAPKEKDQVMLSEYIRTELKRQISYKFCKGQNILPAILLDPNVEDKIRKSIRQTSSGAFLALDPQTSKAIVQDIRRALESRDKGVVIIASIDIRRYVRRLIEAEFYETHVLDFQELTPEISVQPVDRIRI